LPDHIAQDDEGLMLLVLIDLCRWGNYYPHVTTNDHTGERTYLLTPEP